MIGLIFIAHIHESHSNAMHVNYKKRKEIPEKDRKLHPSNTQNKRKLSCKVVILLSQLPSHQIDRWAYWRCTTV